MTTLYFTSTTNAVTPPGGTGSGYDFSTSAGSGTMVKATTAGAVTPFSDTTRWSATSGGTLATWLYRVNAFTLTTGTMTMALRLTESNVMANATTQSRVGKLVSPYGSANYSWGTTSATWWVPSAQAEIANTATDYSGTATLTGSISYAAGDYLVIEVHMDDATGVTMATGYTLTMTLGSTSNFSTADTIPAYTPPGTAAPPALIVPQYNQYPRTRR